ncbi:hypothetical protein GCM10009839_41090 [Catenulispora yoronensis]|uniref:Uncharacterized protein n=1 Tax=Catenulispora yoronensis TaxID=450799 RepID=A0ABN2UH35_9ACTN
MAEQTHQFAGPVPKVVLTDPALADDKNPRVLAKFKNLEHSLDILSRLAMGDQSALTEVGVATTGQYNTQLHEWAIGRDRGNRTDCYLIAGGPGEVNWTHPVLTGLASIGHSHPFAAADRKAFVPNTGPLVLPTLTTWKATSAEQAIPMMPGDLWYLFPSNQDVSAAYLGDFERPEVVYSPYRLAPDGRLSRTQGGALMVKYGPVKATLSQRADALIKDSAMDANAPGGAAAIESVILSMYWCEVEFFAANKSILTGFMKCPPKRGTQLVEFAWFHQEGIPATAMTRSQCHAYIKRVKG